MSDLVQVEPEVVEGLPLAGFQTTAEEVGFGLTSRVAAASFHHAEDCCCVLCATSFALAAAHLNLTRHLKKGTHATPPPSRN